MSFAPGQRVKLLRTRGKLRVNAEGTVVGRPHGTNHLVDFDQYPNLTGGWMVPIKDLAPVDGQEKTDWSALEGIWKPRKATTAEVWAEIDRRARGLGWIS